MRIVIIGLGLIGGSLGLALKNSGIHGLEIVGVPRREETIKKAVELGAIDRGGTDHIKECSRADIVFICTPINLILPIIKEIAPILKKNAVISDVGSSKQEIVFRAEKLVPKDIYFVGGHPMAGKETSKIETAEAGLFTDKTWILTRTSKTNHQAMEQIYVLIKEIGARVIVMDPKTHDNVAAAVSHMPLAVAAAICNSVFLQPDKAMMARCAASGFRDTTRVASGDPLLGVDMFITNKSAVLKMLAALKKEIFSLENAIKEGNGEEMLAFLERAKKFRDSIYG